MYSSLAYYLAVATLAVPALAQSSSGPQEYSISADGISLKLTDYGARVTSVLVADRDGVEQDVCVGYDDLGEYITDTETNHTYFGPIVGRYANRIKNSTFDLAGETYKIAGADHGGLNTLHGGIVGYDARNWTVMTANESSITFSLLDTGFEGFPGTVFTLATYALSSAPSGPQGELRPRLTASIVSTALDHITPIMLSNHIYWNLNGFKAATILNDTYLWLPLSPRYIATDGNLIPNGTIGLVSDLPALDFTSPKLLGDSIAVANGTCGTGCVGVDNAFTVDRPAGAGETSVEKILSIWSTTTGIRMDVSANQVGVQIYTCNGQNGSIKVKKSQVDRNEGIEGASDTIQQHGCIVIEPQAIIDAINHPEWGYGKYEIFSPETAAYSFYSYYDFSTF